jgi:hypothetical protein
METQVRHASEDQIDAPGQDSFLDILANMVGIMILLVMVVGLRVSHEATVQPAEPLASEEPQLPPVSENELNDAIKTALVKKNEVQDLAKRVVDARDDAALREHERNMLVTYVAAFKQELEERRAGLSEQQQRDFESQRKLAEAELTLDRLAVEQVSLLSQEPEVDIIESQPTPIVRGFNGREIYLQLARGHVAIIPVQDLVDELSRDVKRNLPRLRSEERIVGTVGPIGGFRARYYVGKREVVMGDKMGAQQSMVMPQMEQYQFLPLANPAGEPVQQAILPGSDLERQLQSHPCETTVIAIGLYADSVSELHQLKKRLGELGYSTAEVMIPDGRPIAFSPNGMKINVQ